MARLQRGPVGALLWDEHPRVVFLHGGGQNAHTWDTVVLGLGLSALAVDLPGRGRSAVAGRRRLRASCSTRRPLNRRS